MTRTTTTLTAVGTSCIALGLGAGALLNAQAAPTTTTAAKKQAAAKKQDKASAQVKAFRRAVHAELTVPTKDGFRTVTVDRGTVTAVSGTTITLDESTKKHKGRTVTVTVPANATVRADGKKATLAAVKPGMKAAVLQLPKRTVVRAHTPKK